MERVEKERAGRIIPSAPFMNPLKPTFGINPPHYTKPSAPRGNLMGPTYMIGNVAVPEPRRIVPGPKGIHDFAQPLPKNAFFTEQGVRQWSSRAFSGGNLPVPEGGKAKYDPRDKLLEEQTEQRENEFLGRYMSINEDARNLLQQKFAMKGALRDMESYQQLINSGLTDEEAGQVIRKKLVDKVASGQGKARVDYHQKQKDVIAQMAIRRGVKVGLPQSMATSAGVTTSDMNYSATEVAGIQRLLKHKIEKLDNDRKRESMVGQNFNRFPTGAHDKGPPAPGWYGNVATNTVGILPANDNPVLASRQNVDYRERGLPVLDSILGRVNEVASAQSRSGNRAGRLDLGEPSGGAGGARRPIGRDSLGPLTDVFEGAETVKGRAGYTPIGGERRSARDRFAEIEEEETRGESLARVARGGGGNSSSSSLAPPASGGEAPFSSSSSSSAGGARGAGQRSGPNLSRSSAPGGFDLAEFGYNIASADPKDRAKIVQRQATALGIRVNDPQYAGARGISTEKLLDEIERRYGE